MMQAKNGNLFVAILGVIVMIQAGLSGCATGPVAVDFSQDPARDMTKEEARQLVNEMGVNTSFAYYREEQTSSWITSYDGTRVRKSEHTMKTYSTTLEEILAAPDHSFQCLFNEKTSRYIIQAVFTDSMKKKAEVEIVSLEQREQAKELLKALTMI
ncbi:hypothetical protein JXQ70_18930 [bacterium]|nr:hypothetical protein [bacterium]